MAMRIEGLEGGTFDAYAAGAGQGRRAGIIVLQEIFGVNAGVRAKADHFALGGYLAVAPDMFWRHGPDIELDPENEAERGRAFALMQASSIDDAVRDIEATLRAMRAHPDCDGQVGVIGWCWGGMLAYLAAARTDARACVGYYGVGIENRLGEAHAIARPLLLHFGEADPYSSPPVLAAIRAGLAGNAHATVHSYPGAGHAFARAGGAHRDEAAASLADVRTDAFFAQHLRGVA